MRNGVTKLMRNEGQFGLILTTPTLLRANMTNKAPAFMSMLTISASSTVEDVYFSDNSAAK